jgi:hypothetical protein
MFGFPDARISEMSRPNYLRDLAEYARLEYPEEDPRTVGLRLLGSAEGSPKPVHRRFHLFRRPEVRPKAAPGNA